MTLFRGVHRFRPVAIGRLVTALLAEVGYDSPSFDVVIASGSQVCHSEGNPQAEVIFGPGQSLFRHTDRLDLVAKVDAFTDSEVFGLSISDAQLRVLLGTAEATALQQALGVASVPSLAIRHLAAKHAAWLRDAMTASNTGDLHRLSAQAKAVGFLAALCDELVVGGTSSALGASPGIRLDQLHDRLLALQGTLPSLDQLARDYGVSARRLNELFAAEYGAPVHGFITSQRLLQAHRAVSHSDVPLKILADRLGYSHVNHFITAFKRQFGYPPGSLRGRSCVRR